jgi:hypothetical protein
MRYLEPGGHSFLNDLRVHAVALPRFQIVPGEYQVEAFKVSLSAGLRNWGTYKRFHYEVSANRGGKED